MQIKQEKGHYTLYKENEAIGMAVVDGATILRLEIVPEWRGRGYGSYLVKELLRRGGGQVQESAALTWGDLSLERGTFTLSCGGREVRLSRREYDLMELLLRNGSQVVTKEQLLVKVWGYNSQAEDNNVEVYISFLRRKLAHLRSAVKIKTLRMLGYCLTRDEEGQS